MLNTLSQLHEIVVGFSNIGGIEMCFTETCAELALNKIVEFVKVAHKGQMYGDLPYTAHLFDVERNVLSCNRDLPYHELFVLRAVELLYDIVEDTGATNSHLGCRLTEMFGDNMPLELINKILTSVCTITKTRYRTYTQYIDLVAEDKYACIVNYHDAESNLRATYQYLNHPRFHQRKTKYENVMLTLCEPYVKYLVDFAGECDV